MLRRAELALRAGEVTRARQLVHDALQAGEHEGFTLLRAGEVFADLGDWRTAERLFINAIRTEPNELTGFVCYARLCMRAGRYRKAERLLDAALALAPVDRSVHLRKIELAELSGSARMLEREAERWLRLDPSDAWTQLALARAHRGRGRVIKAQRRERQAYRTNPMLLRGRRFVPRPGDANPFAWLCYLADRFGVFGAMVTGALVGAVVGVTLGAPHGTACAITFTFWARMSLPALATKPSVRTIVTVTILAVLAGAMAHNWASDYTHPTTASPCNCTRADTPIAEPVT